LDPAAYLGSNPIICDQIVVDERLGLLPTDGSLNFSSYFIEAKASVLNSLSTLKSRRDYRFVMDPFIAR
jgi:hypothetical protein